MKTLALALVLLLFAVNAKAVTPDKAQFAQKVYDSVVLLYGQTEDGGMKMYCTATAYRVVVKDNATKTRFVSASHCVEGETDIQQKQQKFFITADTEGSKTFIPAKLVMTGDKKQGDDFAIFEVEGTQFPTIPLGDNASLKMGDEVIDVSSPLGLGKQYFEGYVSNPHLDRPPLDAGEVQWTNVMLMQIGGGPGSSGSSVVSADQKAIIGFLVGQFRVNIGMIVVPVDKFKAFEAAVDAGKYKKLPPTPKENSF